uniref:Solute carrier family 22 member 3 n=1 Tax=Magallana gigas TaxID=29159 RepID=K1QW65_MAGGI
MFYQKAKQKNQYNSKQTTNKLAHRKMRYCHIPDFLCSSFEDDASYTNKKLNSSHNVIFQYHQCDVTVTTNLSGTVVEETVPCRAGFEFSGQQTVASEWGLVCEDEGLGGMTTTVLVVGQMVGASVFPTLADKHGRLLIAYTTLMAVTVCFLLTAIVPWFAGFVVMRFLMGMLSQGPGIVLPTLGLELFPTELRGFVISSGTVAWALSLSIIPLVAFLFRYVTWRYTMGAAAVLGIHSFFTKWFLQESPRWLLANNKFDQAKMWIQKAAKCNKKDPTCLLSELDSIKENAEKEHLLEKNQDVIPEQTAEMAGNFKEVMDSESTQVFVSSLTYYGLFLTSGTMSGNMYLNFFLNSVVEIPSVILYSLTINRIWYDKRFRSDSKLYGKVWYIRRLDGRVLIYAGNLPHQYQENITAFR